MARQQTGRSVSDRGVVFGLVGLVLALLLIVWGYTAATGQGDRSRPKPVWLGVSKVMSQLADGRLAQIQIKVQLRPGDDPMDLAAHEPAFKNLVQTIAAELTQADVAGPQGLQALAEDMADAFNAYLHERGRDERVRRVLFEEMMLLPER